MPLPVILVYYSRPELLERCIKTIRADTELDSSICIVDNSPLTLKRIPKGVRIIRGGPLLGYGGGINKGFHECVSDEEFFIAANTDIEFARGSMTRLVETAKGDKTAGIVGPALFDDAAYSRPASIFRFDWDRYLFARVSPPVLDGPHEADYADGAVMLIRSSLFRTLKGFAKKYFLYCEDTDLSMRTCKMDYACLRDPRSHVFHVGHGSTGNLSMLALYHGLRSSLYFIQEYAPVHLRWKICFFVMLERFRKAFNIGVRGLAAAGSAIIDFFMRRTGPGPAWIRG